MSRIELAKIPSLLLYKDAWTEARRTAPIPQLVCRGAACKLYQPEVVRCVNLGGGSGTDVDWKCEADLPETLRFGKVQVSCEGWSRPGDPYVLKGSCSLDYRLVQVPGTLRDSRTTPPLSPPQSYGWGEIVFTVFWILCALLITYNMISSCLRRNNGNTVRRQGGSGPRPGGGGGGGGGWFPGDYRDDWRNPPPPYSKTPPGNPTNTGWRPGFWTGAILGGLANRFWSDRRQAEPRPYWNQWSQVPAQSTSTPSGYPTRRTQTRFSDDDRGEGTSNLGSMRQSSSFGGSTVR